MKKASAKKQAVVLIHGIGEQVPMDTLRGFVDAVWTRDHSLRRPNVPAQTWSKPDELSGDFELRRLTTAQNRHRKRTDFFEFYWAHMMQGTALSHVWAWMRVLLFRAPWRIPAQLRGLWLGLVALFVLALVAVLNQFLGILPIPRWAATAGSLAWLLISGTLTAILVNVAGDAARYLHVAPANIETRRRIREAGIALLQKLHSSGQYDRITVVGHSLGSVIGYDILTHLWPRQCKTHSGTSSAENAALHALEALAREAKDSLVDIDAYQQAQAAYLRELQSQGNGWLISDFITLGSPLAHSAVLLARNPEQFKSKKIDREFPTCPPTLERVQRIERFSLYEGGHWLPHHAAVFAPTRWTNLYFPCRKTLWGDVIGGPLAPVFGPGIRDLASTCTLFHGLLSHTRYWSIPKVASEVAPVWIWHLRYALGICANPESTHTASNS